MKNLRLFLLSAVILTLNFYSLPSFAGLESNRDLRERLKNEEEKEKQIEEDKVKFLKKGKEEQRNTNYLLQQLLFEEQILNKKLDKIIGHNQEMVDLLELLIRETRNIRLEEDDDNENKDGEPSLSKKEEKYFKFTPPEGD